MRGTESQRCLAEFLRAVSEGEQQVEVCRELLAQRPDFDPLSSFQLLDQRSMGYLTSLDLSHFLHTHKLFLSAEESHLLAKSMSADSTGQAAYPGFLAFVLPEDKRLREEALGREAAERPGFQAEYALVRLMEREVQVIRELAPVKQRIITTCSLHEAFRALADTHFSYWTSDDVLRFCVRNSIRMDDKTLKGLFRRLDRNRDGKIDYSDFVDSMVILATPASDLRPTRERFSGSLSRSLSPSKARARQDSLDRLQRPNGTRLRESEVPEPTASSHRPVPYSSSYRSEAQPLRRNKGLEEPYFSPRYSHKIPPLNLPDDNLQSQKGFASVSIKPSYPLSRARESGSQSAYAKVETRGFESERRIAPNLSDHFSLSKPLRLPMETDRVVYSEVQEDLNDRVPLESPKAPFSISRERSFRGQTNDSIPTFVRVLKEQMGHLYEIERSRQDLSLCPDFSVEMGFSTLARRGRRIGLLEFEDSLRALGVAGNGEDCHSLFRRYDRDMDLSINVGEFSDMVKPESYEHANLMSRRPQMPLRGSTIDALKRLFSKLVDYEEFLSRTSSRLSRDPSFSLRTVFEAIDGSKLGYFSKKTLADFIRSQGVDASEGEVAALFRKFDLNCNNRVPFSEFQQALRLS